MTRNPPDSLASPNAPPDGAPPSRPPPPPPASEAIEMPANTIETAEEQLHLVHPVLRQDEENGESSTSGQPGVKPEASAYAGSYRPSEDRVASLYVPCDTRFQM